VCEKPLPPELLLSDEQIAELRKQMEAEDKRMNQFKHQLDDVGPHESGGGIGGIACC